MTVILIALAAFVSTIIGGLIALRFKDKLHLIIGFSGGAVVGVAFFDLIPESIELGQKYFTVSALLSLVACGFLAYLILDRFIFLHAHAAHESHGEADTHTDVDRNIFRRGILGASSLSVHSFLDGVAIGLAFQVSMAVGTIVTVAVLVHDFSDGINTVGLILKNKGESGHALRWLCVDAFAPILGAASTLFFTLPESALAVILALFSGFFLYIGASELIPESHHHHPKALTSVMTVAGVLVLYIAIHFANI